MSQGFTYRASWAGIPIDVMSSNISQGRRQADHVQPKRDGVAQEDEGREEFVCYLEFVFADVTPVVGSPLAAPFADRFQEFDDVVAESGAKKLVHPYVGAKNCKISNFVHNASGAVAAIYCSATFTEDLSLPPVFEAIEGVKTLAGAQEVRSAAIAAMSALGATGATSEAIPEAVSAAESWESDPTLTTRQVQHQLVRVNERIGVELDAVESVGDIDQFPIIKEFTNLRYKLRLAARTFTAKSPRIINITTTSALPLRMIAARIYGAATANNRFEEMLELNPGLQNPAMVPPNSVIKAYALESRSRGR